MGMAEYAKYTAQIIKLQARFRGHIVRKKVYPQMKLGGDFRAHKTRLSGSGVPCTTTTAPGHTATLKYRDGTVYTGAT